MHSPDSYDDFNVGRENIRLWLTYLFENHPEYRAWLNGKQISWDLDALNALPENGNVADQLPIMSEDKNFLFQP